MELRPTSHCKNTDKQANVPASQHDILAVRTTLGFAGSPNADQKNEKVEDDDGDYAQVMNMHFVC